VPSPSNNERQGSVAIICFIPDFGHLQPLLKIADALKGAGFHIKCYIADECTPLLRRFQFDCFTLENSSRLKREKEMARIFSRSTFFNSVCLYVHYLLMYPRVSASAGRAASQLSKELSEQRPDLIISDALWFVDWYSRIAESLGVRLIVNSFDGSLAYNQRPFVQTYGLTDLSPALQTVVEIVSSISRTFCTSFYRLLYFRDWLSLRAVRRTASAKFEAAFPHQNLSSIRPEWLVVGTAPTERERLGSVLRLKGAERREFPALTFRSSVPVPNELRDWIGSDGAPPVVYVSFGSAVEIDARFAKAVYDGLRAVPARVLWSLPASQMSLLSDVPVAANIRFEPFVPQPEILQIENVRCFVTQGGPHSIQEALFGATPMLCIPFFVDQPYNSSIVERLGVGKRLWRRDVSAQSISTAINEILENIEYRRNATEICKNFVRHEGGEAIAQYVTDLLKLPSTSGEPRLR
jgi:UDP-N-acetylglucosamine:LPS N-acetylglucosamine transferase